MFQSVFGFLRTRVELSVGRLLCQAVTYVALAIAAIFLIAALFVWLARTESLVVACLVFAGAFVVIAIGAFIAARVMANRNAQVKPPTVAGTLAANPAIALGGLRALRGLRVVRRNPVLSLGTALLTGIAVAALSGLLPGRSNPPDV